MKLNSLQKNSRSKVGEKAIINRPKIDQNILDITVTYTYWYDIEMTGGSAGLRLQRDNRVGVFADCVFFFFFKKN